jgi:ABC-2 type transport system permease protein
LLDPAGAFMAIAFGALIARGARLGAAPAAIAVVAVVLTLALASVLSTIAGAVLGPGSRRGHDVGTIVTAVALSVVAVAATLLPALATALRRGTVPWLATTLTALPSGWGPVAVQAAARGDWLAAAGSLTGLAVLTVAAADWWPRVLTRRMGAAARPAHAGSARPGRWSALPQTPVGAVTAKEIRMWGRDPIRLTCLLIAVIVGAAVCAIPRLTGGTYLLLPYAGILTAIIAGACACNLYGSDGTSLWLTVMTPDASRADVRGRQAAWLIVVAPYTVAVTIAFTAFSGERAAWPLVLAVLPAVLGGSAGLAPFSSLVSVQPLDETGGPTPAYSLKVHIALVVVALTALVPVLILVASRAWHEPWLSWVAVPAGLVTGAVLAAYLGGLAVARLQDRQVGILRALADAAR